MQGVDIVVGGGGGGNGVVDNETARRKRAWRETSKQQHVRTTRVSETDTPCSTTTTFTTEHMTWTAWGEINMAQHKRQTAKYTRTHINIHSAVQ